MREFINPLKMVEHGYKQSLGSIQRREFLDWLMTCSLLQEGVCSMEFENFLNVISYK